MTAPTPEQMRALEADAFAALQEAIDSGHVRMTIPANEQRDTDLRIARALGALRAAADQLDVVHRWNWRHEGTFADDELEAILTADTAPQEDRNECGVVTESSAGPLVCTASRSHDGPHNTEGILS